MLRKSKDASYFIERWENLQDNIDSTVLPDEEDYETVEDFQEACDEQAEEIAMLKDEADTISEAQFLSRDDYLIHEDDFEEYVMELVDELYGEIPHWIMVDWDSTCDNIKMDYSVVELDGEVYYYRS